MAAESRSAADAPAHRHRVVVVDLLVVADCPNRDVARGRVEEAAASAGVAVDIAVRVITTDTEARRAGMRGSPTLLIDEAAIGIPDSAPTGVACAVYPTECGYDGAPSVEQILAALNRHRQGTFGAPPMGRT